MQNGAIQTPFEQIFPIQFIQIAKHTQVPVPIARISVCGLTHIVILNEIMNTDPPQGRYIDLSQCSSRKGRSTALTLLKLLISQTHRFAAKDWLLEHLSGNIDCEEEGSTLIRLDNVVSLLRGLLCPLNIESAGLLRKMIVTWISTSPESGGGYQLADHSLLWIDADEITRHITHACALEANGQDALEEWHAAFTLGSRGTFLQEEVYGDWAKTRRQEITGYLRQSAYTLARCYQQRNQQEQALLVLRKFWLHHPTDEDITSFYMKLLGTQERFQEALDIYRQFQVCLQEEGRAPDPHMQELVASLQTKQFLGASLKLPLAYIHQDMRDQEMMKTRRQFLQETLEATGGLASGILLPTSLISTEEFLTQSATSIKACWRLMGGTSLALAQDMVQSYIPTLVRLTFQPSHFQALAAQIATQAKILQAVLAMHEGDFHRRAFYCHEAVECARLSHDTSLLAAALMYVAYTYTYCPPQQPKKAISFYQEALYTLHNASALLKTDILIGLADAYAQCNEKQLAYKTIEQAKDAFPDHPEHDPHFFYANCTVAEIYEWEGRMYNDLAFHSSTTSRSLYNKAHHAFTQSLALQKLSDVNACTTLLQYAQTALGLRDLDLYVSCLQKSGQQAKEIGSRKLYQEARHMYNQTPAFWKKETMIADLAHTLFSES